MTGLRNAARPRLRGIIAAIVTPLAGGSPDHPRLVTLARHLLDSGCDGLNLLGTTGEAMSLSVEERMALMSAVAHAKLPMDQLIVGTGAAAITDAVQLSRHAAVLGFAGILLLPPFYYKVVPDSGILAYVRTIVDSTARTPIPIYLYNFPTLSGVPYTVPLIAELLKAFGSRIAGLKDSSRDGTYARQAVALSESLDVFSVSEFDIADVRAGIFAGVISGIANLNSRDWAAAYVNGDDAALSRVIGMERAFDGIPLIPGIKYLLSKVHRTPSFAAVRAPLVELSLCAAEKLEARFSELGYRF